MVVLLAMVLSMDAFGIGVSYKMRKISMPFVKAYNYAFVHNFHICRRGFRAVHIIISPRIRRQYNRLCRACTHGTLGYRHCVRYRCAEKKRA